MRPPTVGCMMRVVRRSLAQLARLARTAGPARQPMRARVLAVSAHGFVALIERRRRGMHYWAVPGGGIEAGESPAEAARREIREELGLEVVLERVLERQGSQLFYLARVPVEHELALGGPEQLRNRPGNSYRPVWVPIARAGRSWLRPGRAAHALALVVKSESQTWRHSL